jgi:hypothetical protein
MATCCPSDLRCCCSRWPLPIAVVGANSAAT